MFLKNRNISSKIKRSKVTDYAALKCPMYFSLKIAFNLANRADPDEMSNGCLDISATDISARDVLAWTFRPRTFRPRKMLKMDISAITINFGFGMCACINV